MFLLEALIHTKDEFYLDSVKTKESILTTILTNEKCGIIRENLNKIIALANRQEYNARTPKVLFLLSD